MALRAGLVRQEAFIDIALITALLLVFCLRIWNIGIVFDDDADWAIRAYTSALPTVMDWAVTQGRLFAIPYGAMMMHAMAHFGTTYGEFLRVGSFAAFFVLFWIAIAVYCSGRLAVLTCGCFFAFFAFRWEQSCLIAGPLAPWVLGSAFVLALLFAREFANRGHNWLLVGTSLSLFASLFMNEGMTLLFCTVFLLAIIWLACGSPRPDLETEISRPQRRLRKLLIAFILVAALYGMLAGAWYLVHPSRYDGHLLAPFNPLRLTEVLFQFSTGNLFLRDLFQPYSVRYFNALTSTDVLSIYKPSTYLRTLVWHPSALMFGLFVALLFFRGASTRAIRPPQTTFIATPEFFAIGVGLVIAVVPLLPVAATAKYQGWYFHGAARSYSTSIFAYFGVSLVLGAACSIALRAVLSRWRISVAVVLSLGVGLAAATSSRMNDAIVADMRPEANRWLAIAHALEAVEAGKLDVSAIWAPRFRSGSGLTARSTYYWTDYAKARYNVDLYFLDLLPPPERLTGTAYLDYFLSDDDSSFIVTVARLRPADRGDFLRGMSNKIVVHVPRPSVTLLRTFWFSFRDDSGRLHQFPLEKLAPTDQSGRIRILADVLAVPGTIRVVRQPIVTDWPLPCASGAVLQRTIEFGTNQTKNDWGCKAHVMLNSGWGQVETRGVWSLGRQARLSISTSGLPKSNLEISFDLSTFTGMGFYRGTQTILVFLNDRHLKTWVFTTGLPPPDTRIAVPPDLLDGVGTLEITFKIESPMNPKSLRIADDDRELGITLRGLRLNSKEN